MARRTMSTPAGAVALAGVLVLGPALASGATGSTTGATNGVTGATNGATTEVSRSRTATPGVPDPIPDDPTLRVAPAPVEGSAALTATQAASLPKVVIGTSVQGRPIIAYRIGDNASPNRRVLVGQIHGNEWAGYQAARRYLAAIAAGGSGAGTGTTPGRVTGMDLWVIPTLNPDGLVAKTRKNARRVDLNRNYGTAWTARYTSGSPYYQGPAPWSEPETVAFRDWLKRVLPQQVVILHQPLNGVDSTATKNPTLLARLIRFTGLPSKPFTCDGTCRGTAARWFNKNHPGALVTVEYGASPTVAQADRVFAGVITAMRS